MTHFLFSRFISTAGRLPSAEHCTCIPSCYANVSSGTSLHRHTPCIFWGDCCIHEYTDTSMYTSCHCNSPHSNLCSCLQIYQPRYVLPPQVPGQLPQMSSPYPGAQVYMPMQPHMSVGPVGQNVPMAYYPMGAVYPPGSTVMVDGGFDAGARFTAGSSVNIPVSIQLGTTTHTTHTFSFA